MGDLQTFFGTFDPGMSLADIHIHTTHSDGWWQPERLAEGAVARGLRAICVTDHDEISGAHATANAAARAGLPLQVYVGQEVSTRVNGHDVHVIGFDIQREIRPWQSIEVTVEAILEAGGIAILPHPKPTGRGFPTFDQLLMLKTPVAVEIFNAGVADLAPIARLRGKSDANDLARAFYEKHVHRLLGAVGGTDAHFRTIARGVTAYHGDLRQAIEERRTAVLFRADREHLMPWDPVGYFRGLRTLDQRRSVKYGPRPRT